MKKNKNLRIGAIALASVSLALAACGGGGGGSSAPASNPTISGTAATGSPMVNANIVIACRKGSATTSSSSSGSYSASFDFEGPCALTATQAATASSPPITLHSLALSAGTANITPLTEMMMTYLATQAGLASASALVSQIAGGSTAPSSSQVTQAQAAVLNAVRNWVAASNSGSFLTTSFVANNTGADADLDALYEANLIDNTGEASTELNALLGVKGNTGDTSGSGNSGSDTTGTGGSTGNTASGSVFSVLYSFATGEALGTKYLTQASDGSFYGVAAGNLSPGSVFHYANGAFSTLYTFQPSTTPDITTGRCAPGYQDSSCGYLGPDAEFASGALTLDAYGNLFGLSIYGGVPKLNSLLINGVVSTDFSQGTIFEIRNGATSDAVVHSFYSTGTEGISPSGSLVRGSNGLFYGVTAGNTFTSGTAFSFDPGTGALAVLHVFAGTSGDGQNPAGGLVLASDGNFYGVTSNGGANGTGTVFRLSPNGTETVLHSFGPRTDDSASTFSIMNLDGASPKSALVVGSDGALYGTTNTGGDTLGSIFRIDLQGNFTVLHVFAPTTSTLADGASPTNALVLGKDGALYGSTSSGGTNNLGCVFKITNSGAFSIIHSFAGSDGQLPGQLVVDSTTGALIGTTFNGGNDAKQSFGIGYTGNGVIFRIVP